jgi:putative ABC transport system ATP-binding protein
MDLLSDLNATGRTIVMVTHEPYIAERAGYQLHMKDGVIDRIQRN